MTSTPLDPPLAELLLSPAPGHPSRPPGAHLSNVIKVLLQAADPKRYGDKKDKKGGPDDGPPALKLFLGMAFEEGLEARIGGEGFRPEPIMLDGIWCSPDRVSLDPWRVQEFKLTWYSSRKSFPEDEVFWPWLVQIKAYCWALDTLIADVWACFVNGGYQPPTPVMVPVRLTFTELELEENWSMIRNTALHAGLIESGEVNS